MSVTLKCQWCNKDFEAKRSSAKFCSGACKMKAQRDSTPPPVAKLTTEPVSESVRPKIKPAVEEEFKTGEREWSRRLQKWVISGECKFGHCIAPDCKFNTTCKLA